MPSAFSFLPYLWSGLSKVTRLLILNSRLYYTFSLGLRISQEDPSVQKLIILFGLICILTLKMILCWICFGLFLADIVFPRVSIVFGAAQAVFLIRFDGKLPVRFLLYDFPAHLLFHLVNHLTARITWALRKQINYLYYQKV